MPDLWFIQFIYVRSMKTKEMLLVRLQTQNEIRFDFLPLIYLILISRIFGLHTASFAV